MAIKVKVAKRNVIYVPILKTKAGERWALSHLSPTTRLRVRPLLELHEHREKSAGEHVPDLCDSLVAIWGTDRSLYLDGIWLHGDAGDPAILSMMFTAATERELRVLPVVRPTFDEASLEQVAAVVEATELGYLIRVAPRTDAGAIDAVVEAVGIGRDKIDLMIDYRGRGMSLVADLPYVPNIAEWRRLIVASGTFPRTLSTLPLRTWTAVPRTCWTSYTTGTAADLPRKPLFSDYLMRDHGAPADFGIPSVNLRYATDEAWMVHVGGKVNEGASGEMHGIAGDLLEREEFAGAEFSAGDAEIERVGTDDENPGNSTQWLQWCANHHIEHVVQQIDGA